MLARASCRTVCSSGQPAAAGGAIGDSGRVAIAASAGIAEGAPTKTAPGRVAGGAAPASARSARDRRHKSVSAGDQSYPHVALVDENHEDRRGRPAPASPPPSHVRRDAERVGLGRRAAAAACGTGGALHARRPRRRRRRRRQLSSAARSRSRARSGVSVAAEVRAHGLLVWPKQRARDASRRKRELLRTRAALLPSGEVRSAPNDTSPGESPRAAAAGGAAAGRAASTSNDPAPVSAIEEDVARTRQRLDRNGACVDRRRAGLHGSSAAARAASLGRPRVAARRPVASTRGGGRRASTAGRPAAVAGGGFSIPARRATSCASRSRC